MELPNGLTLLQRNPDFAVDLRSEGGYYGWLFFRGDNKQWVTRRKMEPWEIMQAEDQREEGIVIESPNIRAG
jgi:hypothetical protein